MSTREMNVAQLLNFSDVGRQARDEALYDWVFAAFTDEEVAAVFRQERCELDGGFLGFLHVYAAAAMLARDETVVVDFGCYLAAQSALFSGCSRYIGVDPIDMVRFATPNTTHFVATAQDFIRDHPDVVEDPHVLAVCSFVPDLKARRLVNATFGNVVNFYPPTSRMRITPEARGALQELADLMG